MRASNALGRLVMLVIGWQAAGLGRRDRDDSGDVPGWVLVTLMSALLVSGLVVVAGEELENLLRDALAVVSP